MIKPAQIILSALLLVTSLTACQNSTPISVSDSALGILRRLPTSQQIYRAAYKGSGSAAFQVSINATTAAPNSFTLLNSTGGTAANIMTDVLALRVFLYNSATAPSAETITPFNGQVFTINAPSSSQAVIFDNVPAGSYYVCAAAFDNNTTFNTGTNLTDKFTSTVDYTEGPVFCSNAGGETGNLGRVSIDATYQVTGTATLQIPLQLQSIVGASIDSNIIVVDGGA